MNINIDNFCNLTNILSEISNIKQEKTNVVSISLFKMVQGYKNFEKYLRGLELIAKTLPQKLPDFKFLLFIDKSIIDEPLIYNRIKNLTNITKRIILIKYECPNFIKDGKHEELFGTFIRFLPFFDFEGNFTKCVISIDADTNTDDIGYIVDDYKTFKKIKAQYHYNTNMFYELISQWALKDGYTILAGRHMCKMKFPLKMMLDYLDCIRNQNCDNMSLIRQKMDFTKYKTFPYGVDEYFLNYIMLPYIKNNNIPYSVTVRYGITTPFFYLVTLDKELKQKTNPAKEQFLLNELKIILAEEKNPENKYMNLFDRFDKLFYKNIYENNNDIDERKRGIIKRYYERIYKMWKDKDYTVFSKTTLKKILNYKNKLYVKKSNIIIYQGNNPIKKYLIDSLY